MTTSAKNTEDDIPERLDAANGMARNFVLPMLVLKPSLLTSGQLR
jgi:hypothetical protein